MAGHTLYANHNTPEKIKSRQKIYDIIASNTKRPLRVLTLPSTNFALEKQLMKLSGIDVECVEREYTIYKKALNNCCIDKYFLGDVFDHLASSSPYDIVWLDLCTPLTNKIINNVLYAIRGNKLLNNSLLAITIMAAREPEGVNLAKMYNCDSLEELRIQGFPKLLSCYSKSIGKSCILNDLYQYNSTGSPMIMYSFTIKNK